MVSSTGQSRPSWITMLVCRCPRFRCYVSVTPNSGMRNRQQAALRLLIGGLLCRTLGFHYHPRSFLMDSPSSILKIVGQVAGIGGIALGVFLLIFREVVRRNIFPNLAQIQAYRIIRLIVILTFCIAALGIGAWAYVQKVPVG